MLPLVVKDILHTLHLNGRSPGETERNAGVSSGGSDSRVQLSENSLLPLCREKTQASQANFLFVNPKVLLNCALWLLMWWCTFSLNSHIHTQSSHPYEMHLSMYNCMSWVTP